MTIHLNHRTDILAGVASEWADWCWRWLQTSSQTLSTARNRYYLLLQVGRWLFVNDPEITSPKQWTRELAIAYVAAVDKMNVGDWGVECRAKTAGKPLSARSKAMRLTTLRLFFLDCQAWGWLPVRFDPNRCFALSRSQRNAVKVSTLRVIDSDIWAKLLYAGLNLVEDDLQHFLRSCPSLDLLRAVAVAWLFAGLRPDELLRLRLGCVEPQTRDWTIPHHDDVLPENSVCMLEVPPHKSGNAFRKPVHPLVGNTIGRWEAVRPPVPPMLDNKTGQQIHYLFIHQEQPLSNTFVNRVLIPLLCRKMNLPLHDSVGRITCSRARMTIATQLANGKNPMSLLDLKAWLGHKRLESTQYYIQTDLTERIATYRKAEYFKQNLRTVEVLLDRDGVQSGAVTEGEPFLYYDLGHGYCTYDFFDQCPHRMACARCSYYRPLETMREQWAVAKTHLERYLEEIPLTDAERLAVTGDLEAVQNLYMSLADTPTPVGSTPRQLLVAQNGNIIPVNDIEVHHRSD